MSGFGVGGPDDDGMAQRGVSDDTSLNLRRARMFEAIELVLKCWTEPEPFDFAGEFFSGKRISVQPKPLQKPFMPVGIASASGGSNELAARNGFLVLMSQYDTASAIRRKGEEFVQAAEEAGVPANRKAIRVCRYVYVSDSVKKAKNELRASMIPSIEHHKRSFPHHFAHVMPPSGKIEDINFDYLVDVGYSIVGDPDTVYDHLQRFYDDAGGFGMLLLLMGKDYGTRQQRARSMRMFMEHVAPRLRELDPDRKQPIEAPF
jgi:alkanesulfonate monooxygenase SsuD/methylene tetrahydromethanopterin reductase-like flavin-dependent oxidoreductase (luciferase family)